MTYSHRPIMSCWLVALAALCLAETAAAAEYSVGSTGRTTCKSRPDRSIGSSTDCAAAAKALNKVFQPGRLPFPVQFPRGCITGGPGAKYVYFNQPAAGRAKSGYAVICKG